MADRNDWNRKMIDEFRANGGKVGGMWEGRPLLLLTTTGARSGQRHTTPTMYLRDSDRLLIFATKGGAPSHPDWYTTWQLTRKSPSRLGTRPTRLPPPS